MLLVLAGATCCGRSTMLKYLAKYRAVSTFKLYSTCADAEPNLYQVVTDAEYDAVPGMETIVHNSYRTGLVIPALVQAAGSNETFIALACSYDEALELSKYMPQLKTQSICLLLHCRVTELLARLNSRRNTVRSSETMYRSLQSIYTDVNRRYIELETASDANKGFSSVISVDTGRNTMDVYEELIIKRLLSILEGLKAYNVMQALRHIQREEFRYANT